MDFLCTFATKNEKKMQNNNQRLLSKALFELRKKSKLTQRTLADVMGISVSMYSMIELGERSVQENQIPKLARCLKIDVKEIRALCLADKINEDAKRYSSTEIQNALKILKKQYSTQKTFIDNERAV